MTGNLRVVEAAAAELPEIALEDALRVLCLLADKGDPRFDRAAARWLGRLLLERPVSLGDARYASALVERLPASVEALYELVRAI